MKNIKGFALAGMVMVASMLTITQASAQAKDSTRQHTRGEWNHGRGGHRGHNFAQKDRSASRPGIPNLTTEQQKKIEALRTPFQKETLPLRNLIAEKRAHLHTLQTTDKADINAVNGTIDEIGKLQTQVMKKEAAHREEVRKLLTDDQRIAFDSRGRHRGGKGMMHR